MHLCLSCHQPCNISAIFCESCRLSLLECSVEAEQVEAPQEEDQAGGRDGLVDDLVVQAQVEANQGTLSAPLRLTEGGRSLFWSGSRSQTVETLEEEAEVPAGVVAPAQATSVLLVTAPPVRRQMPTHVRRALWIFCIVGLLALSVDGVLLALSMTRHHQVVQSVHSPTATLTANPLGTSVTTSNPLRSSFILSSAHLAFTTTQGQGDPQAQTITLLSATRKPFAWKFVPGSSLPTWLRFSAMQGNASHGTSVQVVVSVTTLQLAPGTYTASLFAHAFDLYGKALSNSPQALTVSLTVLTPCSLSVTPEKLSFVTVLLSAPTPQTLNITEHGDCARPIQWKANSSASWLTISSTSGFDSSVITVQASSSSDKLLGTSTAVITIWATDTHGFPLSGTPVTITATLTVIA